MVRLLLYLLDYVLVIGVGLVWGLVGLFIWCFIDALVWNWLFLIYHFRVLVGAFSDFRTSDTGNPVQILPHFPILLLSLKLLGLI